MKESTHFTEFWLTHFAVEKFMEAHDKSFHQMLFLYRQETLSENFSGIIALGYTGYFQHAKAIFR